MADNGRNIQLNESHQLRHHFYVQVMEMTDLSALVGKKKKKEQSNTMTTWLTGGRM